ncbi:MerR family transcriptional regulator [Actinomadura macrotermitis]|uniref:HTH merR-type domain-containing protein n=1 Tax=Actinomadura macrotermitis TaxID=2585200 RepID=A0A7K0BWI0_9ACTN|nr:hypothetical protein [Actinomadura macrotermitis]
MSEDLLPIGRFARLCRLSVKQLRHYDELGLLAPAHVDSASGYRYYRRDQVRDALSIGLLRSLDVPLPTIGRVLSGEGVARALRETRDRLEADLLRRRQALDSLERVLAEGLPRTEVTTVREPARRVRIAADTATPATVGAVTAACVARLLDGGPAGVFTGIFPLVVGEEFPVRVAAEPGGETLPGGVFAAAVHVGPYSQVPLTAHALLAWCAEHGHDPRGPVREVYLTDPSQVSPEELVTRVMIGLEETP